MENHFELLTEKEEIWAKMLIQVLEDHHIPCTAIPAQGVGLSLKTGVQDSLRIYVPRDCMEQAQELLQELFSSEFQIPQFSEDR